MEILSVLVLLAIAGVVVYTVWPKIKKGDVDADDINQIVDNISNISTEISDVVENVVEEVTKPKLPSTAQLEKLTKAQLEEKAKSEFGVDLDKRMTKANMIKDLRAQYKKL